MKDVAWVDTFNLPSVFDSRLGLYKEWHDFALYDRGERFFALLNFGVHGNPYNSTRGYGAVLAFVVGPRGKAHAAMRMVPLDKLRVSRFSPDFIGDGVKVSYSNTSFIVKGKIDDISLNLNLPVTSPPITGDQLSRHILARSGLTSEMSRATYEMSRIWDTWVELPRLGAIGRISVGDISYPINTNTAYQDHEGGRFDWGTIKGWDIGVLLCDRASSSRRTTTTTTAEPSQMSFLFYRYGPSGQNAYGGIIAKTSSGKEKNFGSEKIEITRSGEFSGERAYLPGVTRLLYPDYHPPIPKTIRFSTDDPGDGDQLEITFTPEAICTIVAAGGSGEAETAFNEMFCMANLRGTVGGETYNKTIPCWFESVRPRGRLKSGDAPET